MPATFSQLHRSLALTPQPARTANAARTAGAVVAASVLVAVGAHVSLPLPFTPVPVVLSDMAVLLVGLLLGPWAGAAAMLLYLAEGLAGFPVFSPLGPGGIAQLLGPTGGFLMSYPLVAFIAGWLSHVLRNRLGRIASACIGTTAATLPLFACGAGWLASGLHLSPRTALQLAVTPFLGIAMVKIVVATALVSSLHQLRAVRQS